MRKVRREVTRKFILAAVIGEPNAGSNAMYGNRAHDAVIRVYNDAGSMVESRRSRTNRGPTQKIAALCAWVFEVLVIIGIRTARGILLQAIDERLRKRRFICRHVRGKVGIRHVEKQEIYEIDRGG